MGRTVRTGMTQLRVLAATLVLLVAGCAAESTGGATSGSVSYGPDDLVVRVDVSGGWSRSP